MNLMKLCQPHEVNIPNPAGKKHWAKRNKHAHPRVNLWTQTWCSITFDDQMTPSAVVDALEAVKQSAVAQTETRWIKPVNL